MSKPDTKNLPASILDRLMTQSHITGLNVMLSPSLLREMGFIFLTWANQAKFSIRMFGKMEAILSNDVQIGVTLDDDTKSRVYSFLGTIDCLLWEILSPTEHSL